MTPCASSTSRYSRRTDTVRSIASGRERPGAVDALPEARDAHEALDREELRVAARAVDIGDEQAHRVGADVDRADPAHAPPSPLPRPRRHCSRRIHGVVSDAKAVVDPGADGVVAAGEEVRVVGVEALDAGAGAADAARRPRAVVVGRDRGVTLGRVGVVRGAQRARGRRRRSRHAHRPTTRAATPRWRARRSSQ